MTHLNIGIVHIVVDNKSFSYTRRRICVNIDRAQSGKNIVLIEDHSLVVESLSIKIISGQRTVPLIRIRIVCYLP